MEIFPAIDIKGGQVVRLTQGDYNQVDIYGDSPPEMAHSFAKAGAKNLHIVDLDGARDGAVVNFEAIRKAVEESGLAVQVGGGIRDEARIKQYLNLGVRRVILGTAALENFDFLSQMVNSYGNKIAVGVDAKDGRVAVKGWLEVTRVDALDFCRRLERAGVATVIYTDIARDGMGLGSNLDVYRILREETGLSIIASGGISRMDELTELNDMGIYGAILGKALYTGKLNLEEVLKLC